MANVTQTLNFNYTYADSLTGSDETAAISRANALAMTCEADLASLQGMFGVSGGFGESNRVTILINFDSGLGTNFGYQSGGNTQIIIRPFTGADDGDAAARAVFVAEMSEVLMDYRNTKTGTTTWIRGNSMGEALSTVCEALLHPEGYYTATVGSPRITSWLNFPSRSNSDLAEWVKKNKPTDADFVSFGCGIVFIYYLHSALDYSMNDIITRAGSTLEETYKNLTGHYGGWDAFHNLLDLYYPDSSPSLYSPVSDNLFPLLQIVSLTLSPDTVIAGNSSIVTITLDASYSACALSASAFCLDPGLVSVPTTVPIPAGTNPAQFLVTAVPSILPFDDKHVDIYISLGGRTLVATLIVQSPVIAGILASLTLFPDVVTGGSTSQGRVTLKKPVPIPTVVGLAAVESGHSILPPGGDSSVGSVPPSVTIPAGGTEAWFSIQTTRLALPTVKRTVTIIAGAVVTKQALLTVER